MIKETGPCNETSFSTFRPVQSHRGKEIKICPNHDSMSGKPYNKPINS